MRWVQRTRCVLVSPFRPRNAMFRTADNRHHLFSFPCSVAAPSTQSPPPWSSLSPPPNRNRNSARRNQLCCSKRPDPIWDSNAESVRTGRFRFRDQAFDEEETDGRFRPRKKRSWWSDDPSEFEEESELFDEESSPWNRIWFVKVGSFSFQKLISFVFFFFFSFCPLMFFYLRVWEDELLNFEDNFRFLKLIVEDYGWFKLTLSTISRIIFRPKENFAPH